MQEGTRMGQTVCYPYMVAIHVFPAQNAVSCVHMSMALIYVLHILQLSP